MYAITGITGKVGGEVARTLSKAGLALRAVVRDPRKGAVWADLGCDVAVADVSDAIGPTRHPGIFKGECNEQSSQ